MEKSVIADSADNRLPVRAKNDTSLVHPRFGDLTDHRTVVLPKSGNRGFAFVERPVSFIHLSVTGRCFARCKGCINAAVTHGYRGDRSDIVPIREADPVRDAACIVNLLQGGIDRDEAVICFYGGEPLLATAIMDEVVQRLYRAGLEKTLRYMLYTNGDLLARAVNDHPDLMKSFWLTSVSIDGRKKQHEAIRLGTSLDKIRAGLVALQPIRKGHVLMWSTLREEQSLTDCFEEFMDLHGKGLVDQFFWHWAEIAEPFIRLEDYARGYEADLRSVMDVYLSWLESDRILPVTHLNELVLYLLTGKDRGSSACGIEKNENFDLMDGAIHACADLPPDYAIGSIDADGTPRFKTFDFSPLVAYKNDLGCRACGMHKYCGGRCPVQAFTHGTERLRQYCQLMRLHAAVVMEYLPAIEAALVSGCLGLQDLYDQSAFYAQFTDVTP